MITAPISLHARSRARRLALQALYQWQLTALDNDELVRQFQDAEGFDRVDQEYFYELLSQTVNHIEPIDEALAPCLSRVIELVDPVERAILRMATYELLYRQDIPFKVVLNEAVTLTKKFGAEKAHAFVNGVLDKLAHKVRAD
ncbi:MAG: transcription antitermination factor NusB [Gammaproteobacteria bacterium]|nr:transcription antitermination factor NusB [Gammaproteobacteria bacterium]